MYIPCSQAAETSKEARFAYTKEKTGKKLKKKMKPQKGENNHNRINNTYVRKSGGIPVKHYSWRLKSCTDNVDETDFGLSCIVLFYPRIDHVFSKSLPYVFRNFPRFPNFKLWEADTALNLHISKSIGNFETLLHSTSTSPAKTERVLLAVA